jgi:ribokinase
LRYESRKISVRAFCRALISRGVGSIVLTDGGDGAFAAAGNRIIYCPAHEANVAGTAGAGDAFCSTYAAYSADGKSPDLALRAAALNAAGVLAHVDTQTGLMRRAALESQLGGKTPTPNVMSWEL